MGVVKPGTLLELEQYNPDSVITTIVLGVLCASYHRVFVVIVWSLNHVQHFCNPMDHSLQGSSVHRILQARILEWVAVSLSRGSSWPRDRTCVCCFGSQFFTSEPSERLILRIGGGLKVGPALCQLPPVEPGPRCPSQAWPQYQTTRPLRPRMPGLGPAQEGNDSDKWGSIGVC